jgi:hypothetical protein
MLVFWLCNYNWICNNAIINTFFLVFNVYVGFFTKTNKIMELIFKNGFFYP